MDTNFALDTQLAALLGYFHVMPSDLFTGRMYVTSKEHGRESISRWTCDDGAAFRLACDLSLGGEVNKDRGVICITHGGNNIIMPDGPTHICINAKDFPDLYTAVRVGIVLAAIEKLKGQHG